MDYALQGGFLFKSSFQINEMRVDNPQLSSKVVGSSSDSNRLPFAWELGVLASRPQGINQGAAISNDGVGDVLLGQYFFILSKFLKLVEIRLNET